MKIMQCMAVVSAVFFSASIAVADASYDNTSGQSAQLTHTVQDRNQQRSHAKGQRDITHDMRRQKAGSVEVLRERNALGQSDAMSVTPAYRPAREAGR